MATEFDKGFAAGWLAASRGLAEALNRTPSLLLANAGSKPGAEMPRRRGRPPKALAMAQAEPVKRGRGRPRKAG
jgi:hypothetical protein